MGASIVLPSYRFCTRGKVMIQVSAADLRQRVERIGPALNVVFPGTSYRQERSTTSLTSAKFKYHKKFRSESPSPHQKSVTVRLSCCLGSERTVPSRTSRNGSIGTR